MKPTAVLLATALAAAPAVAGIDGAQSQVKFVFKQMNVPVEGAFKRFAGDVRFDAKQPDKSRADIEIELDSIDTGSSDADTEAKRKAWFDTANHPKARFTSSSVRRLAADRYEVNGQMTIKGRTRPVSVPVQVISAAGGNTYEGTLTLKRLEFAIGEGPWADTDTVADEVQIKFRIVQRGAAP
jgi:polyisoprenoid-binding protein YceI